MLQSIIGAMLGVITVVVAILALMTDELNENKKIKFSIIGVLFALAFWVMLGSVIGIPSDGSVQATRVSLECTSTTFANLPTQTPAQTPTIVLFDDFTTQRNDGLGLQLTKGVSLTTDVRGGHYVAEVKSNFIACQ